MKIAIDKGSARGKIYAFERRIWFDIDSRIQGLIYDVPSIWDDEVVLDEIFNGCVSDKYIYKAKFSIKRNGVTSLVTESLPENGRLGGNPERLEHSLAAQAYFCLRDLLHSHRFHAPSSDTIIDVYGSEKELKNQVNFGLMRRALAARRLGDVEAQHKALGIISYLRAFRENVMSLQERQELAFSLAELEAAIRSEIPLIETRQSRSIRRRADQFSKFVIYLTGLLFGYASLIKDSKVLVPEQLPWLRAAFVLVQEKIGFAFILIALGSLALSWLLAYRSPNRDKIIKTASRLSLAFSVRTFALFEIILGTIMLLGGGTVAMWMLYTALHVPTK